MRLCRLALVTLFAFAIAPTAHAQQVRNELIRNAQQAYDNFESARALDLLRVGVNPGIGATDSVWASGVHLLAQILVEEGQDSLANIWMRWAVRLAPTMAIDRARLLPEVVSAYDAARDFVGLGEPGDQVTVTTWEWSALGTEDELGSLRAQVAGVSTTPDIVIQNVGPIAAGESLSLRPGSYAVDVSAEGYEPARVTREVLPGIQSVLEFDLRPLVVAGAVADSVLPDDVEMAALSHLGRISVTRFGTTPTCAAGFVAGTDGLLVTTYRAIRGAEALEILLADGRRVTDDILVAAYDTGSVAVLKLPAGQTDSVMPGDQVSSGQFVWALSFPECRTPTVARLRVAGRDGDALAFADSRETAVQGGPLIDQRGAVVGLAVAPLAGIGADRLRTRLEDARGAIAAQQLLSLRQVAERENHLYGSVDISSDLVGSIVQIQPLEAWHWPELAVTGSLPRTFSGPMGRYQLDLLQGGQVRRTTEYLLRPGTQDQFVISPLPVAQAPAQPQIAVRTGGGKFPWPIALVGVAGAGAAVALLAGGGGDGGNGNPPPPPSTGGIIIAIPNP